MDPLQLYMMGEDDDAYDDPLDMGQDEDEDEELVYLLGDGDEDMGRSLLSAMKRRLRSRRGYGRTPSRRAPRRRRPRVARPRPMSPGETVRDELIAQPAGVPTNPLGKYTLGFPTFTFDDTSGTAITFDSNPQKPFKAIRLVLDIARTGVTATGLITLTQALVGNDNVLVNSNGIGAGAFAANSFDTTIAWPAAKPGVLITLQLQTTVAPGVGDQIDVAATLFGPTALAG